MNASQTSKANPLTRLVQGNVAVQAVFAPASSFPFSLPFPVYWLLIAICLAIVACVGGYLIYRRRRKASPSQTTPQASGAQPTAEKVKAVGEPVPKGRNPNRIIGLIVFGIGVAPLIFTLITAFGFLSRTFPPFSRVV